MSLLPQRKKSAEEIAKLRESLGIEPAPGEEIAAAESQIAAPVQVMESAKEEPASEVAAILEPDTVAHLSPAPPLDPLPVAALQEPNQVRSLKHSERIPILPVEESGPPTHQEHLDRQAIHLDAPLPLPQDHRQVRSLRKSEQVPLTAIPKPPPDSPLPVHRHNDLELNEIRRREALSKLGAPRPRKLTAHLAVVIPGYLFAIGGAVFFYFYDPDKLELRITAGCVIAALLIAAFIFVRKPLSRHHAAFISVVALFVIVFGALHYFPQLRHGT